MNLLGKAGSPAVCENHADFARAREEGANGVKFLVPRIDRVRAKDVKWVGMLGAQDAFNLPREDGIWHGPLLAGFRRGRLRSGSRNFSERSLASDKLEPRQDRGNHSTGQTRPIQLRRRLRTAMGSRRRN